MATKKRVQSVAPQRRESMVERCQEQVNERNGGQCLSLEPLKTKDMSLDKNAVLGLLGHFLRRGRAALQGRVFDAVHERPLGPVAPQGLKPTPVSVNDAALEAPRSTGLSRSSSCPSGFMDFRN